MYVPTVYFEESLRKVLFIKLWVGLKEIYYKRESCSGACKLGAINPSRPEMLLEVRQNCVLRGGA